MAGTTPGTKHQNDSLIVDKRNDFSARCTWTIPDVKGKIKQKAVWSKDFDVGGYDCRLLVYPGGGSSLILVVYLALRCDNVASWSRAHNRAGATYIWRAAAK
jgi:hypothetical protein